MRLSLILYFFLFSFFANSQIFFSEYAEGSSYNKYLEIYNHSDDIVDLSNFAFPSCSNGCDVDGEWDYMNYFPDGAVINPGDVYVISHPNTNNPTGQYYTEEIAIHSDHDFTYLSNGNDLFGLINIENQQILDVIGSIGPDPGDGWDVAGVVNATKDHTLVRKSNVSIGNSGNWVNSAGTNSNDSEWIVLDNEVWDNLGFHQCDSCGFSVVYGCTDSNAINYNVDATIDDGSCEYTIIEGCTDSTACNYDSSATNGFFIYSNTDANMTIALEYTVGLSAGLESGDLIGVFYTDNFGNLVCGGTAQWNNESLAIAAWGTESGLDNGFDVGEEFEFIIQKFNGQMYSTINTMNTVPPFSSSYTANGFGQITSLTPTEILLDEENCFYPELYYDCDGNCINDSDGDGICDEFELSTYEEIINTKLLRSVDITGRVINDDEKFNKILINIFENGKVKKSIKTQ